MLHPLILPVLVVQREQKRDSQTELMDFLGESSGHGGETQALTDPWDPAKLDWASRGHSHILEDEWSPWEQVQREAD